VDEEIARPSSLIRLADCAFSPAHLIGVQTAQDDVFNKTVLALSGNGGIVYVKTILPLDKVMEEIHLWERRMVEFFNQEQEKQSRYVRPSMDAPDLAVMPTP